MNIRFGYLYRDGANYKNYHSIVFSNSSNIPIEDVLSGIQQAMIDGMWFYARKWGLKELYSFPYDSELDHDWHEFEEIATTDEEASHGDVLEFLKLIKV